MYHRYLRKMKFLIHTLDEFGKTQMGGYIHARNNKFIFLHLLYVSPIPRKRSIFLGKLRFGQVQMLSTNCLRLLVHPEILERKRKANKTLK